MYDWLYINGNLIRHLDLPGRQMEALSQEQLELARRQIDLANAARPPLFGLGGQKYFWYVAFFISWNPVGILGVQCTYTCTKHVLKKMGLIVDVCRVPLLFSKKCCQTTIHHFFKHVFPLCLLFPILEYSTIYVVFDCRSHLIWFRHSVQLWTEPKFN